MRKVMMEVSWVITEVIEVTLTDVELKSWSDEQIVDAMMGEELMTGNIAPPYHLADVDCANVADAGGSADRKVNVVWGDPDE